MGIADCVAKVMWAKGRADALEGMLLGPPDVYNYFYARSYFLTSESGISGVGKLVEKCLNPVKKINISAFEISRPHLFETTP